MSEAFVVPLGRSSPTNGATTKAMDAILSLVRCLHPAVTMTTVRQLSRIVLAMLAMTGRVTMLGLARWAGTGGSYRTISALLSYHLAVGGTPVDVRPHPPAHPR